MNPPPAARTSLPADVLAGLKEYEVELLALLAAKGARP